MTQHLHNKALMATVKELMATHQKETGNTTTDFHQESNIAASGQKRSHSSDSNASDRRLLSPKAEEARRRRELSLDLTLDSYPSTDSLHVLDELLCDIRRSCTTSLTSTPISSDGEVTGADTVFECKLRRSETELRAMGKAVVGCCGYGGHRVQYSHSCRSHPHNLVPLLCRSA